MKKQFVKNKVFVNNLHHSNHSMKENISACSNEMIQRKISFGIITKRPKRCRYVFQTLEFQYFQNCSLLKKNRYSTLKFNTLLKRDKLITI